MKQKQWFRAHSKTQETLLEVKRPKWRRKKRELVQPQVQISGNNGWLGLGGSYGGCFLRVVAIDLEEDEPTTESGILRSGGFFLFL